MKFRIENATIGATLFGGCAATAMGFVAAGSAITGTISAVGATVGGVIGGVVGSGMGIATGGAGIAATVPFAAAGAAVGGWAGPALALVGIGTAPAWAVPVAIGGGALIVGSAVIGIYKLAKWISTGDGLHAGGGADERVDGVKSLK